MPVGVPAGVTCGTGTGACACGIVTPGGKSESASHGGLTAAAARLSLLDCSGQMVVSTSEVESTQMTCVISLLALRAGNSISAQMLVSSQSQLGANNQAVPDDFWANTEQELTENAL